METDKKRTDEKNKGPEQASGMQAYEIVHILTDGTRFRLVTLLLEHPYCVKALAKKLGVSEPAVSQQMQVLRRCGLVTAVRIGYQTHYRIDQARIALLLGDVARRLTAAPQSAAGREANCACEFYDTCVRREQNEKREE